MNKITHTIVIHNGSLFDARKMESVWQGVSLISSWINSGLFTAVFYFDKADSDGRTKGIWDTITSFILPRLRHL